MLSFSHLRAPLFIELYFVLWYFEKQELWKMFPIYSRVVYISLCFQPIYTFFPVILLPLFPASLFRISVFPKSRGYHRFYNVILVWPYFCLCFLFLRCFSLYLKAKIIARCFCSVRVVFFGFAFSLFFIVAFLKAQISFMLFFLGLFLRSFPVPFIIYIFEE